MSVVTQYFTSFLAVLSFLTISACSDSSNPAPITIDNRFANIETPFSISEGSEGEKNTLIITFVPTVTGQISYETFNITAAEKSDFAKISGDLNVVEGIEVQLSITVYGDDDIEGIELIGLKITHNNEDLAIYYGQILNDDFPPIEMVSTTVLEGDTGTALLEFTFSLQSEIVDPYSFQVTSAEVGSTKNDINNEIFYATPGIDFEPVEQTIEFNKDVSEISIYVEVFSDNILELDERVELQVLSSIGFFDSVYGVIRTDDTVEGDGFGLETSSMKAKEGDSEDEDNISWNKVFYTVNVTENDSVNQDQNIQIRLEGKEDDAEWATLEEDFCANNYGEDLKENSDAQCESINDYTLTAGSSTIDVSFFVKEDLEVETSDEKIKVYLQNNQGVSFSEFIHTIEEDDFPGISITYQINGEAAFTSTFESLIEEGGLKINEPSDDNVIVTIDLNLQKALDTNFDLSYQIVNDDSTNISSADYSANPSSGTTTITSGTMGSSIQLIIKEDSAYEELEKISLKIDNIGTLPISIINTDLPELVMKEQNGTTVDVNNAIALAEGIEGSQTYTYRLALDNNERALSDFILSYELSEVTEAMFVNDSCGYLNSESKFSASRDDFKIYLNDNEVSEIDFALGQSSVELDIKIINDDWVECLEYIPLKFTLSPKTDDETNETVNPDLDVVFSISNTDKTTLRVSGWSVGEGSSDADLLPDTEQAFELTLGQALVTNFTYKLTGENEHSCGPDDIKNTAVDASVGFNGAELAKSIAVQIPQDNIVEPDEVCVLTVASLTNSDQIDLLYCNETGSDCNSGLTFATGVIKNDDKLIIEIRSDSTVTEPEDKHSPEINPLAIKWDKTIAGNVGDIVLTLTNVGCAGAQDCVGNDDYSLASDYIIKAQANTDSLVAPVEYDDFAFSILSDNIVENNEFISLSLTQSLGSEFIDTISQESLNIEIISEDTLSVGLEKNESDSTCIELESDCQIEYEITFDKDISDDVNDLSVDLLIANTNTSTVKVADDTGYVDATIYINGTETHPEGNKINIPVLVGGEVQSPVIKITLNEDNVVEVDETLSLFIEKNTVDDRYSVSGDIIQAVNNDDFLDITFTQSNSPEKDLSETLTYPFTYTWDKEISPDVPTIQFVYESVCGINGVLPAVNCAEANDSNIASISTLVTIHETAGDAYTSIPGTPINLNVNYALDNRVEADEHLTIEINKIQNTTDRQATNESGRVYVSHLNGLTSDTLELNSIIQNDDYLSLTVADITSTDDTCTGFSGESGCNIYSISWGSQVADSDAGDIIVPLSLPSLSSNTRYSADGTTNPKDYSVLLNGSEITYADGANSLNLGSGLGENESVPLVVNLVDDDFVEPGESLTVSLNATDSPYVSEINLSDSAVSVLAHTIPLDDLLTVTIIGSGTSGVEAGDTGGVTAPFTYTTDKPIAVNTPILTMILAEVTCIESCAILNSDFTLPAVNILHNKVSSTAIVSSAVDVGITILEDNIVENHERMNLRLTSNANDLVQFSGASTQNLNYTINNVDTLNIVVTDITDHDATCSGFNNEEGCKLYDISWVNGTDSILGDVNLALNTAGSTSEMLYTYQVNASDIIENPKDFALSISDEALDDTTQIPLGSGLSENGSAHFKVSILNDDYVELGETLALNLSASAGSDVINSLKIGSNAAVLNSDNAGYASLLTYSIPATVDRLNVSVSTATSAPEAGDTNGVSNPFTYTTTNKIVASVPNIFLEISRAACDVGQTCATPTDDFTLPSTITLHTAGIYTDQNQIGTNLGVEVIADNIIESDEVIKLSLSAIDNNGAASPYVSYTTIIPTHTITNIDSLNIVITDNTSTNVDCSGFSEEAASCRSYNIAWENILQSGAASLSITEAGNNVAARTTSFDSSDDPSLITDPKDYNITVGGNEVAGLITLVNEDSDGNDTTNSMTVTVNIEEDDFVEPSEKLNIYFSKPAGDNTISSITGFDTEDTITHTIPIDDQVIVTIQGDGTSANEPIYVDAVLSSGSDTPFTYTLDKKVAANTPNQELRVDSRACDNAPCATRPGVGQDFTVPSTKRIHTFGSFTSKDIAIDLGVRILADEIVESDENVKIRVREISSGSEYISNFSSGNITSSYTINNDDKTVLSFVAKSDFNGNEGNSGSGDIEYSIQSSRAVSSDIGKLYVNLSLDANSTADASDATIVTTLEFKGNGEIAAGAVKNFNVEIIGDTVVELDETVIPVIALHADPSDYTEIDSTKSKGATYTINNDDYIELVIIGGTCSESSGITNCAMTEGDTGNSAFTFKPTAEYETQGITDPSLTFSAINTSTASGTDYSLVESIALDTSVSDVGLTGLEKTFLTIVGDKIIERNESVLLAATIPSYVALSFPTEFTINNDDYVTSSLKYSKNNIETTLLEEGGDVNVKLCVPATYSVQSGEGNLSFIVAPTQPATVVTESNTYKIASCDDGGEIPSGNLILKDESNGFVSCGDWSVNRSLTIDGIAAENCTELTIMSAVDDVIASQNSFFDLELTTSDERIDGVNIIDAANIVLVNDDLINVLDTGLVECVERGTNQRWDVPCSGDNSNVPDATHNSNYQYQDGAVTDFYPEFSFTYIDEYSNPVQEKPTDNDKTCFQDNSTGLIWSPSSTLKEFSDSVSLNDCDLTGGSWITPSVHELITIMDLNPLSDIKPLSALNNLNLGSTGSEFWSDHSRYWSSDSCSVDAITGQWAVDFISGHIECVDTSGTEKNYFMKVYK